MLHADHAGAELIRLDRGGQISMRGPDTFREAVACLSAVTREALDESGWRLEDIALFVYHQANSRIIRAVGGRLGLDPQRVVDYVGRFANSSTATLPIALSVAEQRGSRSSRRPSIAGCIRGRVHLGRDRFGVACPAPP